MKMSVSRDALLNYLAAQLAALFPDAQDPRVGLAPHLSLALDRTEFCFSKIGTRYYFDGHQTLFDHLNGDHYAMFLYFFSNVLHRAGVDRALCARLFLLNKCLHGIDAFYEVSLPDVFLFMHPLGTVLGRGNYSNFLIVYQRCGVGANHDVYPTLHERVTLHPGASVFGNCIVGQNSRIAADSLLIDTNLEPNSVYFGKPGAFSIRTAPAEQAVWRE